MLPGSRGSPEKPRFAFFKFGIAKYVHPLFLSLNCIRFQSEAANHKMDTNCQSKLKRKESENACQRDNSVSLFLLNGKT